MGNSNFFAKVASVDPLAQALHLPGATKYAQQEAQDANSSGNQAGPYAGVAPTLAGANAGYAPGGPGANSSYVPFHAAAPGGLFGFAQRAATTAGDTTPNPAGGELVSPNAGQIINQYRTGSPITGTNPYAAAAQVGSSQQAAMQPNANRLFATQQQQNPAQRPVAWGG